MKFLDNLAKQYQAYNLDKPQWLKEYTDPVIATSPGAVVPQAGGASTGSVVDALMKAVKTVGLDTDPDVKKVKDTVAQKVADAKKQIVDKATKTVDTITKAVQTLNQASGSAGQAATGTIPATPVK